jgi:hypothetical protein
VHTRLVLQQQEGRIQVLLASNRRVDRFGL